MDNKGKPEEKVISPLPPSAPKQPDVHEAAGPHAGGVAPGATKEDKDEKPA